MRLTGMYTEWAMDDILPKESGKQKRVLEEVGEDRKTV